MRTRERERERERERKRQTDTEKDLEKLREKERGTDRHRQTGTETERGRERERERDERDLESGRDTHTQNLTSSCRRWGRRCRWGRRRRCRSHRCCSCCFSNTQLLLVYMCTDHVIPLTFIFPYLGQNLDFKSEGQPKMRRGDRSKNKKKSV